MAEFTLQSASPLRGYARDFGDTRLSEVTGLSVVAAAIPLGAEDRAAEALRTAFGAGMPAPGRYVRSAGGLARILRKSPDQLLFLLPDGRENAEPEIAEKTGDALWLTDQSDAFCGLEISGPAAREALARICPLDLHPDHFGPDHATRTLMEHLSVTILRIGQDGFWLLSARSSARDFLRAVETSLENL